MTTIPAHGGGAQPASIDTSGKIAGGAALRVYGFDSEADAIAAGYVCEGGPAMSVAIITDAQIASGAWKTEGDPNAIAIYTAPATMPVEGGYAVPVYPVNGWGSAAPAGDPIGDALRADAVAYYKFDSSGADATGRGNTLTNLDTPVTFPTGKINNAVHFNNISGQGLSITGSTDWNTNQKTVAFVVCGWVKLGADTAYGQYVIIDKYDQIEAGPEVRIVYQQSLQKWTAGTVDNVDVNMAIDSNWHFIVLYSRPGATVGIFPTEIGFSIDGGAFTTDFVVDTVINQVAPVFFGTDLFDSTSFLDLDEMLYLKRSSWTSNTILTQDELDYLYNSGAGRALFP